MVPHGQHLFRGALSSQGFWERMKSTNTVGQREIVLYGGMHKYTDELALKGGNISAGKG